MAAEIGPIFQYMCISQPVVRHTTSELRDSLKNLLPLGEQIRDIFNPDMVMSQYTLAVEHSAQLAKRHAEKLEVLEKSLEDAKQMMIQESLDTASAALKVYIDLLTTQCATLTSGVKDLMDGHQQLAESVRLASRQVLDHKTVMRIHSTTESPIPIQVSSMKIRLGTGVVMRLVEMQINISTALDALEYHSAEVSKYRHMTTQTHLTWSSSKELLHSAEHEPSVVLSEHKKRTFYANANWRDATKAQQLAGVMLQITRDELTDVVERSRVQRLRLLAIVASLH